jgi:CHAD domain-containing protein
MAEGKWIHGLRPEMELAHAAQEVLTARLEVVRQYLPRAIRESEKDTEHVHQLRVATRRADAALRIFRSCLAGRIYRTARGRLRTIRRAAGAARDWDVFLLSLCERQRDAAAGDQAGLDFLIGYSLGQRIAAQSVLAAVETNVPRAFDDFMNETIDSVRHSHEVGKETLIDLGRPMLKTMLENLRLAAAGNLKDYDHLHQVRITGKRLRYAMEVFADCFPPAFREQIYPQVEEMQEILGRANDSHVASGRLFELRQKVGSYPQTWERGKPGIESLMKFHQRRLPQERRRFVRWWGTWQGIELERLLISG